MLPNIFLSPGNSVLKSILVGAGLGLALMAGPPAWAETPEEKGLAIAREADRRADGFGDNASRLAMTLRSAEGKEALREMRYSSLEKPGDGDRSLIVFDTPKDVEGTALLTFSHKTADDDVWLYLPSLSRVKRIASNNKSGAFMGSEFAFEDIGSQEVEKFKYKYLRDETLDGMPCSVIEQVPTYANSGYTKQIVWHDQAEFRVQKIEYYDRKDTVLKTLRSSEYQKYLERYWQPGRMEMVNHQTGRSTTLLLQDYKFRNGYTERDFDQASLQTAR